MKIYKKLLNLFMVMTILVTSFIFSDAFTEKVQAAENVQNNVQLCYAQINQAAYHSCLRADVTGYICVKNLAYNKNVTVHYSTAACYTGNLDRYWTTVPATYYKTNLDGTEIWTFSMTVHEKTEFAISYEANGQTYWDNNYGNNYNLYAPPANLTVMFPPTYVYGNSIVRFVSTNVYANPDNSDSNICDALVSVVNDGRTYGDPKTKIRYTEDDWATYKEVFADQSTNIAGQLEYKHILLPVLKTTKQIKFAVAYSVDGHEYWDNNFGQNYTVDTQVN